MKKVIKQEKIKKEKDTNPKVNKDSTIEIQGTFKIPISTLQEFLVKDLGIKNEQSKVKQEKNSVKNDTPLKKEKDIKSIPAPSVVKKSKQEKPVKRQNLAVEIPKVTLNFENSVKSPLTRPDRVVTSKDVENIKTQTIHCSECNHKNQVQDKVFHCNFCEKEVSYELSKESTQNTKIICHLCCTHNTHTDTFIFCSKCDSIL